MAGNLVRGLSGKKPILNDEFTSKLNRSLDLSSEWSEDLIFMKKLKDSIDE